MVETEKFAVCIIILWLESAELSNRGKLAMHVGAIKVVYFSFGRLFVLFISSMQLLTHFINIFNVKVHFILTQFDVFIIWSLFILLTGDTTSQFHQSVNVFKIAFEFETTRCMRPGSHKVVHGVLAGFGESFYHSIHVGGRVPIWVSIHDRI